MIIRTTIFTILMAISLNCYCQIAFIIQFIAKYQKGRIELERINPYESPNFCIEKSNNQLI